MPRYFHFGNLVTDDINDMQNFTLKFDDSYDLRVIRVLDLKRDEYVLLHSCYIGEISSYIYKDEYAWILSRSLNISPKLIEQAEEILFSRTNMSRKSLTHTWSKICKNVG